MARIKVSPPELQQFSSTLWNRSREIEGIKRTLDRALNISGWEGSHRQKIESVWQGERAALQRIADEAESLARFLSKKSADFAQADQQGYKGLSKITGTIQRGSASTVLPAALVGVGSWLSLRDIMGKYGLGKKSYNSLKTVYGFATGKLDLVRGTSYPGQVKVYGSMGYHKSADLAPGLRHISGIKVRAHIAKEASSKAALLTFAVGGAVNAVENWHDYKDEGMTKVVTATVLDTALDTALTAGGTYGGAMMLGWLGLTIGGPVGAAIGAKIGGSLGGMAGNWASQQIKKTDAWENIIDWTTNVVSDPLVNTVTAKIQYDVQQVTKGFQFAASALASLF
jgi:uncharacterized protein YukE/outer membrane lipoprotein SlyB